MIHFYLSSCGESDGAAVSVLEWFSLPNTHILGAHSQKVKTNGFYPNKKEPRHVFMPGLNVDSKLEQSALMDELQSVAQSAPERRS